MEKIIEKYVKVYDPTPGGNPNYTQEVTFSDGVEGIVYTQTAVPWWKSGDTVEVTMKDKKWGKAQKDMYSVRKIDGVQYDMATSPEAGAAGRAPVSPSDEQSPPAATATPPRASERNGQRDGMMVNNMCALYAAKAGTKEECAEVAFWFLSRVEGTSQDIPQGLGLQSAATIAPPVEMDSDPIPF